MVKTLTGSISGAIAAGATSRSGEPRHLDGRQRHVRRVQRGRRRLHRGARQAGQQRGDRRDLRRPRRATAVRHVRGRGRPRPAAARCSSAPTARSATSPVRPPGRRAVTLNATGSYVEWTTKDRDEHAGHPLLDPGQRGRHRSQRQHRRLRQRHLPQAPRPDLAVRVAVRRRDQPEQLARLRRPAAHLRRGEHRCWAPPCPAGATIRLQKARPATRSRYAIDFINTELVAPIAEPEPGAVRVADRLHPPGRAERARQGPHGHHRHAQGRLPAAPATTRRRASSRCTARRSRSSAPGRGSRGSTRRRRRRTPTSASAPRRRRTARRSADFAYFGNYTIRIDGPGKVFDFTNVVEHDDRQHLGRAHGLHALGRQHRQHHDHELPHPQHVRRRHQHDQRQRRTTGWPTTRRAPPATTASRCSRRPTRAARTRPATSTRT